MVLTSCLRNIGVTEKLLKTKKLIKCPKCNFEFDLMYSRAIACQGCRYAILGCDAARCPKCDHEFSLKQTGLAKTKESSKELADYMSKIVADYIKSFGENPSR
jgi:DNA-directed RNA polymerase subunit RPC12/RpoP